MPINTKSRRAKQIQNQKKVFQFLVRHFKSQRAFNRIDVENTTSWRGSSFRTYWSKQLTQFTVPADHGLVRVSEAFRHYATWEKFQQHVTQVRHVRLAYDETRRSEVLVYEFFMPLSNEAHLKTTLDSLFYEDTILWRLRAWDRAELESRFEKRRRESIDSYLRRVCRQASKLFVGYSLSHVNGRFRNGSLASQSTAARIQASGGRYLIDETTAIVRFIIPCKNMEESELVRWFFRVLFIESILQVVNGEDEIWLVESGMRNCLHVWRIEDLRN